MKYAVATLEGALLDAAAAKADDRPWRIDQEHEWCVTPRDGTRANLRRAGDFDMLWHPSTEWDQGGPIIQRERITVQASQAGDWRAFKGDGTTTAGSGRGPSEPLGMGRGDTPLIAGMRAFVASLFGEEIELP